MAKKRYKGPKGKAWDLVKLIARLRDKDCYTCGARGISSYNAHAGHYQPVGVVGSNNKKAWDIRFIKLQCGHCNGVGQGRQVEFRKKLVKELGEDVVAEYDRAVSAKEVDPVESWEELIEEYKTILQNETE